MPLQYVYSLVSKVSKVFESLYIAIGLSVCTSLCSVITEAFLCKGGPRCGNLVTVTASLLLSLMSIVHSHWIFLAFCFSSLGYPLSSKRIHINWAVDFRQLGADLKHNRTSKRNEIRLNESEEWPFTVFGPARYSTMTQKLTSVNQERFQLEALHCELWADWMSCCCNPPEPGRVFQGSLTSARVLIPGSQGSVSSMLLEGHSLLALSTIMFAPGGIDQVGPFLSFWCCCYFVSHSLWVGSFVTVVIEGFSEWLLSWEYRLPQHGNPLSHLYFFQACYGIVKVPDGNWLCRTCVLGINPQCLLCPTKGGAMKATRAGTKWAHVSCALWIPEVKPDARLT